MGTQSKEEAPPFMACVSFNTVIQISLLSLMDDIFNIQYSNYQDTRKIVLPIQASVQCIKHRKTANY
jgi:hypothetical protein